VKGKCPHCEAGCDQCENGFAEFSFATGDLFTIHCLECGYDNGGNIVKGFPSEASGPCVMCEGKTEWLFVCKV
jgi:hypothetical protein